MGAILKVGLTGNIGSGKTMVGKIFEKLGIPVYRADEKGRSFLENAQVRDKIREEFGDAVFGSDGRVDREKLAAIVFNDDNKLEILNQLIHPLVREDFSGWAGRQESVSYVIQEAAILFETGQNTLFDKIITVTAPRELRIKRVCRRDGTKPVDVLRRESKQMEEARKVAMSDFVIVNDGNRAVLPQVIEIHEQLNDFSIK